ncbi:hypothetical protein Taro_029952, partial [Colocasia esculenta]|nr:hypothetical protein [Colocasia esculenta]
PWVPVRGGTNACGFLTWWCVQGLGRFCLWALDLVEGYFRFVPDSVGFCGSRVWTGNPYWAFFARLTHLLPSARGSSSRELGVRWVAEAAVASCVVSNSESECCELLYLSVQLPCKFRVCAAVGCSCCCIACVASVVARCVRAVVARLAVDSLAVVFPVWRTLASKSRRGVLSLVRCSRSLSMLVLVEVRFPQNCVMLVSGCCYVALWVEVHRLVAQCSGEGLRYVVGLAGAFWQVFPERCLDGSGGGSPRMALGAFGGGSPQSCFVLFCHGVVRLAVRLAVALVSSPCCSFLSFLAALVGLRVPVARMVCFVSRALRALPDGGLVSVVGVWMVVLLMEVVAMLHCGIALPRVGAPCFGVPFGADMAVVILNLSASRVLLLWVSGEESPSVGPVSSRAVGAVVALSVVRQALVVVSVPVFPLALGASVFGCGVSHVAVGNCVLCQVLLATKWVVGRLVPTAGSIGGCSRAVFGLHFSAAHASFDVARHLWGCRPGWMLHVCVASWVSDATVILVATRVCVAFLSRLAYLSRSFRDRSTGRDSICRVPRFGHLTPCRVAGWQVCQYDLSGGRGVPGGCVLVASRPKAARVSYAELQRLSSVRGHIYARPELQTHTFIFPGFEATILLEELELMLGLPKHKRGEEHTLSYTVAPFDWVVSQCKRKTANHLTIAKAAAICICGVILFPAEDGAISFANLSIIDSISEGMSIAQAVLGYPYAGLSSAATGGPFYGSVIALELWMGMHIQFRAMDNLSTECKSMLHHPLAFAMTVAEFDMRPRFLHNKMIRLPQRTGLALRLIGNEALALYNPDRCHLQCGAARMVVPLLSHYPPIQEWKRNDDQDERDVWSAIVHWEGCAMSLL